MTASGIHETDKPYVFKYRGAGETNAVPPQVPFSAELLPEEGHPRRRLADWVTHKENRAFARATVNRVWALMFGRPLVTPVDQIPLQATTEKPFPPGLEALADDFIANNYDLRRLIRVIASTRVFQLDSEGAEPPTDQHDAHWAAFGLTRLRPEQVAGSICKPRRSSRLMPMPTSSGSLAGPRNGVISSNSMAMWGRMNFPPPAAPSRSGYC